MRCELRSFNNDGRIDVVDLEPGMPDEFNALLEQVKGFCVFPLRLGVGKVRSEIPQRRCAQERIGNGVAKRIGIRMAEQPLLVRNLDAS